MGTTNPYSPLLVHIFPAQLEGADGIFRRYSARYRMNSGEAASITRPLLSIVVRRLRTLFLLGLEGTAI